MSINVDSIKTAVRDLSSSAYKAVNTVGSTSINGLKTARGFVKQHTPESIKSIKTPRAVDTFVQTAKEKAPEFVKTGAKFVKGHKETFIGGAVILAAAGCAFSIIKGIANKIKESKQKTN